MGFSLKKLVKGVTDGGSPFTTQPTTPRPASTAQAVQNAPLAQSLLTGTKNKALNANPALRGKLLAQANQPQPGKLSYLPSAFGQAVEKNVVQPFVTRPAAEVVQTVRDVTNGGKPAVYHPNSGFEKAIFGDTPVQSIQQKVVPQYQRQSTSSNPFLRAASKPLAVGEVALSVANDIPVLGGGLKAAEKVGAKGIELATPKFAGLKAPQVIMDTQKLDTLHAALQKPTNVESQQNIINGLHQIKNDHGLDFISGAPNQRAQRITQYLEQNGEAIPQLQAHQAKMGELRNTAIDVQNKFAPGLRTNAVNDAGEQLGMNGKPLKAPVTSTKLVPTQPNVAAPAPRPVSTKLVAAPSESSLPKILPDGTTQRGFTKNLSASSEAQNPTVDAVINAAGGYKPITNAKTIAKAAKAVSDDPNSAFARIVTKPQLTTADEVATGQLLLRQAVESGDIESAIQVGTKLGVDGTKLGQAVQAYAMWKKTSPEGVLGYAAKRASKVGKNLDPKLGQELVNRAKQIAEMPEGFDKAKATRELLANADSLGKDWKTNLSEILSVPRALMATADFSAPLRQGAILGSRFPKQFAKAFGESAKYMFNPKYYEHEMYKLTQRPTYALMKSRKLSVDAGENLTGTEEQFLSNVLEGKVAKKLGVGHVIAGSDRAYSGFLTKLRADVFDQVLADSQAAGVKLGNKELDSLAKFINSASGRGDGNITRQVSKLQVLFSARLWKSRLDTLNPAYYARLDPLARKYALQSAASFAGIATTILGLAKASGLDVNTDPRNADFGKIKNGNTRYDVLGGLQQNIRLAAQLATGQKINSETGEIQNLGADRGFGKPSRLDLLYSFVENKENPLIAYGTKVLKGTDAGGNKVNPATEAAKLAIPLNIQGTYETIKDTGNIPKSVAANSPGVFGIGVQTYGTNKTKDIKSLTPDQQEQYRDLPADQKKDFLQSKLGSKVTNNDKNSSNKSGVNALDKLEAEKKLAGEKLKASLSTEDYKLSKLNKTERQQLIDSGAYTQEKFDGLDGYVKTKKQQLGIATASGKTDYFKSPDAEYKALQKAYDSKVKSGGYKDAAQKIKADNALAKAKAGSTFEKSIRDAYELKDDNLYDYVANDKNGKAIAEKVIAYGDALVKAGVLDKNKLRDKYGNVILGKSTLAKRSGSSGRAKSNTAFAAALRAQNSATSSNDKALRNLISGAKVSSKSGKSAKVASVALKKQSVKKSTAKTKVRVA